MWPGGRLHSSPTHERGHDGAVPPRTHARPGTWILIAIVLAAALIGTLWVPFYNHTSPTLGGFPFFYWYQLMWVPIVAILSGVAYLLSKLAQRGSPPSGPRRAPRRRRAPVPGGTAS